MAKEEAKEKQVSTELRRLSSHRSNFRKALKERADPANSIRKVFMILT